MSDFLNKYLYEPGLLIPGRKPSGLVELTDKDDIPLALLMQEGGGSIVRSHGRKNITGTLHSNLSWVQLPQGTAIDFPGGDSQRINLPTTLWSDLGLSRSGPYSIEMVAKADAVSTRSGLFVLGDVNGAAGIFVYLEGTSSARFSVGEWSTNIASVSLTATDINHIVATYDGSTLEIYANGVQGTDGTNSFPRTNIDGCYIGDIFPAYNREHNGQVLFFNIYNRVLSSSEIYAKSYNWFSNYVPSFNAPLIFSGGGGLNLSPTGIPSAEAFGNPIITTGPVQVQPTGIASAEAVAMPAVSPGSITLMPGGMVSQETFGSPTLSPGAVTITVGGIVSAEAFGSPVIDNGQVILQPSGIGSAETFGTPVAQPGAVTIDSAGIVTAEAFGVPVVLAGGNILLPQGIASAEAFGTLTVQPGGVVVVAQGIASAEAVGDPALQPVYVIAPTGIPSAEVVGDHLIIQGAAVIAPTGIPSAEAFGSLVIIGGQQVVGWLLGEIELRLALGGTVTINPALDGEPDLRPKQ